MRCTRVLIVVLMVCSLGAAPTGEAAGPPELPSAEAVLFSSGAMDASTGINVTGYWVADDFEVMMSATATTVSIGLGDWNGDFPTVFDGSLRWWITTDVSGEPGGLVAIGTAIDTSYMEVSPPGGCVYTTCYSLSFNLGQQVSLTSGTRYWLILNVNRGLDSSEGFSWIKSATDSYANACYGTTGDSWTHCDRSLSFSIFANSEVTYLFAGDFETGDTFSWSYVVP